MAEQDESPSPAVVIPGIDTASSTAAVRSLGRRNIEPIVLSEHDSPPGFASKYCGQRVPGPDPESDTGAYEHALQCLARRPAVETILPFREIDVYALARHRDALAAEIGTPWPALETLRRVQDRIELKEAAQAADVAMPRTTVLSAWEDWDDRTIVKPRYTVHAPEYSDRFEHPRPETDSTRYLEPGATPDPEILKQEMDHEPIVQEFVPSTAEYGFFALYDHGTAVATFQHRQARGWKYAGGPSAYRESVDIPALEAAGRALLDELEWHGVAMVEFLYNPDSDQFELMEVNPRFWSSLPFTIQAGVDFPHLTWRMATEQPLPPDPTYEVGIGGHLLRGELLYLHSILTEEYALVERPSVVESATAIAASIIREPRFDYLSTTDPKPFLTDWKNTLASAPSDLLPRTELPRPGNVLPGRET